MSYNDNNPERSARRHRPALWALAVAIGLAVVAFLLFAPLGGNEPEGGDVEVLAPGTDTAPASDPPVAAGADQGTTSAPASN